MLRGANTPHGVCLCGVFVCVESVIKQPLDDIWGGDLGVLGVESRTHLKTD